VDHLSRQKWPTLSQTGRLGFGGAAELSEAGPYLRRMDFCTTQLWAQGPSRTGFGVWGLEVLGCGSWVLGRVERLQGYCAYKKAPTPLDQRRALGIGLL